MPTLSRRGDPANVAKLQRQFLQCLLSQKNAIVASIYNQLKQDQSQNQPDTGTQDVYSSMFNDKHTASKITGIGAYIFNEINSCLKSYLTHAYTAGKYSALKQLKLEKTRLDFTFERSIQKSYDLVKAANIRLATHAYVRSQLTQAGLKSAIEKALVNSFENIALTEVMRQKVLGAVNTYLQNGVKKAVVMAEFRTAGDNHVCALCESYERKIMTLKQIGELIPVHPRCRCWFQVLGKEDDAA